MNSIIRRATYIYLYTLCLLISAACTPSGNSYTGLDLVTVQPTAMPSTPTIIPSLTPSAIPTHPLEFLRDKLPSVTPAFGFVMLEIPTSVPADVMITVTILTASGVTCSIQYLGPNGLSRVAELEPQIADANGICSWTWKQSMGNKLTEGTGRITITANGDWETYFITVVK